MGAGGDEARYWVPKGIMVVTPEEVERRREIVGTIVYCSLREGKVLYARSQ
ncbi:hypothetical protein MYX65_04450 [Acidobacteria bacterium AH-259-L09]|nr:hypothetical protein [Acidobacteria bacterium AH-259-L09]